MNMCGDRAIILCEIHMQIYVHVYITYHVPCANVYIRDFIQSGRARLFAVWLLKMTHIRMCICVQRRVKFAICK